jgi:hypothetical protein
LSNRTIIEISHDYARDIEARPDVFLHKLLCYLRSTNQDDRQDLKSFGVNIVGTAHHTDERVVTINGREYVL